MIKASFYQETSCVWRIDDDVTIRYNKGEIFVTSLVDLHHQIVVDSRSRAQCSRRHIELFGTFAGVDEKIWHIHIVLHAEDVISLLRSRGVSQTVRTKKGVGVLMLTREEVDSVKELMKIEQDDDDSAVSLSFYESPLGLEVGSKRHRGRQPLWQAQGVSGFDVQLCMHIPWSVIWTIGAPDRTAKESLGLRSSIKITDTGKTAKVMPGLVKISPIDVEVRS